jgi:hypothetical protein
MAMTPVWHRRPFTPSTAGRLTPSIWPDLISERHRKVSAMIQKPTKLFRALELRDIAIKVLKLRGARGPTDRKTTLQLQTDDLHMLLRTPFQRFPDAPKTEHMNDLAALNGVMRTHPLPYGLDIWSAQEKVLSLSWDGNCKLTNFQPGSWEAKLKELTIDHESWAG